MTPLSGNNAFAIRAENVSRHYQMGGALIRAVNEVTLSIRSGEFVALLGSSGSGKSTLLNLLAGLDRPTSGAIVVQNRDLAAMNTHELAQYRSGTVGMVFQSFNLLPRMTLEENIELPLRLAEVDRSERSARVREALQRVRLEKRLSHRPSILLADEPTGNLDSVTGEEVMLLLKSFNQDLGMTVVMVTHERPLADRFAHRILTLADGKLISEAAAQAAEIPAAGARP